MSSVTSPVPSLGVSEGRFLNQVRIGKGSFGEVYSALDTKLNEVVAIKKIPIISTLEGIPLTTIREITSIRHIDHPNVAKLLDATITEQYIILVYKFMRFDLMFWMDHNWRKKSEHVPISLIKVSSSEIHSAIAFSFICTAFTSHHT